MFECRVQAANHFCSRFEQRLSFWFIDFVNVAPQMIDQLAKFLSNIRGMCARILCCNRFHTMGSPTEARADALDSVSRLVLVRMAWKFFETHIIATNCKAGLRLLLSETFI